MLATPSGSLEQLVRLSPAGVPFQDTKLAALITPEASLERLVPLVDYLAAWKLLLSVSPWVLHTVERGYRIQMGSPPPRFNGVNPTLVGPEQALVMEREVEYSLEKGGNQGGPSSRKRVRVLQPVLHSSQEGWRVASHFRSAILDLHQLNRSVSRLKFKMLTGKYLRSCPRTGLSI